ncbi:hypothetical protein Tco_0896553 [Tanacetum coccineum]
MKTTGDENSKKSDPLQLGMVLFIDEISVISASTTFVLSAPSPRALWGSDGIPTVVASFPASQSEMLGLRMSVTNSVVIATKPAAK